MKEWTKIAVMAAAIACLHCDCQSNDEDNPNRAQLAVLNETPYFLNVFHTDDGAMFLPPGESVYLDVIATENPVEVFVSPGQNAEGEAEALGSCCEDEDDGLVCGTISIYWDETTLDLDPSSASCYSDGSCPFVLAADENEDFALIGEMLSGAVFEGAQRTDLLRLGEIKASSSQYRTRIRTTMAEVDHIDHVELVLVDHDSDVTIAPDQNGKIFAFQNPVPPLSAVDSQGKNIRNVFEKADGTVWEGSLDGSNVEKTGRDHTIVEFTRPEGSKSVKLLMLGRNSPAIERILFEFLRSLGPGFRVFHRGTSVVPGYSKTMSEAFQMAGLALEVDVFYKDHWKTAQFVSPVGASARRWVAFELDESVIGNQSEHTGANEKIRLKLQTIAGGWQIDQIVADFSEAENPKIHVVQPKTATSNVTGNALKVLGKIDGNALEHHRGDSLDLDFELPRLEKSEMSRTALLRMHGYYDMPTPCEARTNVLKVYRWWAGRGGFTKYARYRLQGNGS